MADEKEAEATEAAPAAEASSGSNKAMMGMMVVNMIVMIVVVAILFLKQKETDSKEGLDKVVSGSQVEEGERVKGKDEILADQASEMNVRFYNIGEFTANLTGPSGTNYVRVNINFRLSEEVDDEEMKRRSPQVRDRVITLLNSKKPSDLQSTEGRDYLKEEIVTSINGFLHKGEVLGVYFSTLIFE